MDLRTNHGNCQEKKPKPKRTTFSRRNLTKNFGELSRETRSNTTATSVKMLKWKQTWENKETL